MNASTVQEKIQPVVEKVQTNRYLKAVTNGLCTILPAIMIGSVFVLLQSLPITPYQNFLKSSGLYNLLGIPVSFTTNIIALLAAFFMAYHLAESFEASGATAGLLSLVSFLIVTPLSSIKTKAGAADVIPFDFLGAKGLFVAIIVALIAARLYVAIDKKGFVIKMPDSVPPAVSQAFVGIIPGIIIATFFLIVNEIFKLTPFGNIHQFIYTLVQAPLSGLTGSYGGMIISQIAATFLWFFGIHGGMVVMSALMPIMMPLDLQNLAAYQAGKPLPNIVCQQFGTVYSAIGGIGCTLGLVIYMAFRAKSKRYRTLGRIALPGSFFVINEPVIFGLPLVLNPVLAVPFFITAPICSTIGYVATVLGIVPRLNGVQMPWCMPPIASGILQGSWKIAVLQVIIIIISALIYIPFFKHIDKKAYLEETAGSNN